MDGFVFPNEAEVQWSLLIVLYPFITGLVAGAFVVSSLYHVFNIKSLKPVASFSLLTALSFLLVAPLPLQAHLGRPERGFLIFLTPNSAPKRVISRALPLGLYEMTEEARHTDEKVIKVLAAIGIPAAALLHG